MAQRKLNPLTGQWEYPNLDGSFESDLNTLSFNNIRGTAVPMLPQTSINYANSPGFENLGNEPITGDNYGLSTGFNAQSGLRNDGTPIAKYNTETGELLNQKTDVMGGIKAGAALLAALGSYSVGSKQNKLMSQQLGLEREKYANYLVEAAADRKRKDEFVATDRAAAGSGYQSLTPLMG